MKRINILLIVIFIATGTFGQSIKLKRAQKLYTRFAYTETVRLCEQLIEENKDVNEARQLIAASHMKMHSYLEAERHYGELFASEGFEAQPDEMLNYALALKSAGKYKEADTWYAKYGDTHIGDSRVKEHKGAGGYPSSLYALKDAYEVTLQSFNSPQSDFSPTYFGDKLIFTSNRKEDVGTRHRHNWNGNPFLDVYVYDKSNTEEPVEKLNFTDKKVNTRFHEGPAIFDEKNQVLYFTRNNYLGKLVRSDKDEVNLKIYSSKKEGEKWTKEVSLPINSDQYSVGHPALNTDGTKLYFTSDMPGGKGGKDIWYSVANNGEWTQPINAGSAVNTEGDEMFPFIDTEGNLYFSSNGHVGLGGLDLFKSTPSTDGFSKPINMGAPLSSTEDDFGLIANKGEMGMEGYFSSNREGGNGNDDIYSWKSLIMPLVVKGVAKEKNTGEPIANAQIKLKDTDGNEVETTTDAEGNYQFPIHRESTYGLAGAKEKYFDGAVAIDANVPNSQTEILADLVLEKDPGLSLYALVTDKKTGSPLPGVSMLIVDNLTGKQETHTTPESGDYRKPLTDKKLNDRGSYNLTLSKEGYFSKTVTYNAGFDKEGQYDVHSVLDLGLDPEVKDLAQLIEINPINFDYNKYKIRPDAAVELDKIVEVMNKYPGMVVELGSHTDARGSDAYNRKLSDRRAKASAAYIKKHITKPERIYGKGYGEAKLINHCDDGVKCSDDEHEKNRRTEFKVLETGNDKVKVKSNGPDSFDK